MTLEQAKERHGSLAAEIQHHDILYYVHAKPVITDQEYDRLYQELLDLEAQFPALVTPDSPTQRVGGKPVGWFDRVEHKVPMLSLEKIKASTVPGKDEVPDTDMRKRLQDENSLNELRDFDRDLQKRLRRDSIQYILEPKVDGVSISVHYRHGKLVLGATRGDGRMGDDITSNIRTIRAIPLELNLKNPPALLEVRGEAYISINDFEKMNAKVEAAGEEPFPNARNATAGTLKQLDPRVAAQRPLNAVFYAVGACEGIEFETHDQALKSLKEFGLPTQSRWWVCNGVDEVIECYTRQVVCNYDEKRDLRTQLPYDVDGIVVKVNTLADWRQIPAKSRAPGYAIVHKPIPWITPAETRLRDITVQVGRTGVLTPVAELDPVFVQGSTISRATLHNEDEIRRKDIRIGDCVIVRKAGMVIPEVVEVVKSKRPDGTSEFDLVSHIGGKCPACGGPIIKEEMSSGGAKEVAWRCENVAQCPAQKTRRVEYFAQRRALDIESLGDIVAEKLIERGLVHDPLDLFNLSVEQLGRLNLGTDEQPRTFGEKNAAKVIQALERARHLPLNRWIYALAIADVGEATAYQLAQTHKSLEELATSPLLKDISDLGAKESEKKLISPRSKANPPKSEEEKKERECRNDALTKEINELKARLKASPGKAKMPEVGPVAAASVLNFFSSETGRKVLQRLRELNINPTNVLAEEQESATGSTFAGKTFVLTGTLSSFTRDEATEAIRSRGGTVSSSVSKSTDYVVFGEEAGSKLEKARTLGVKALSEQEFQNMLNSQVTPTAPKEEPRGQGELF